MNIQKVQELIDTCGSPADMVTVAGAYLAGEVLHDPVAAEAWLMKAIAAEDPLESPKAMAVLAKKVLGQRLLTPEDERDIRCRVETARGEERQLLQMLLELNAYGEVLTTPGESV